MKVGVHKLAMASPDDVSGLAGLIAEGTIDPETVVAVIGKTEGNGGANDFTRGYATACFAQCLGQATGRSVEEVLGAVIFIWSGGTEGVLSPHATVFTRENVEPVAGEGKRLALGMAFTPEIAPEAIGTLVHVEAVARAVEAAREDAGIDDPGEVHYVQVKGPLLTPAKIADADRRGAALVTRDPNGSKPFARGAMGLGVAVGLGEIAAESIGADAIARDLGLYSSVASTSAGGELSKCEVVLLGNAEGAAGDLLIGHAMLDSVIDRESVLAAIGGAAPEEVVAVFAKAEAAASVNGRRTTMMTDADIHYERHARAALGAVIASVTGDPAIFVSGGTEHQCPPGKAPIAAIVRA